MTDFDNRPLPSLMKRLWLHGFLVGLAVVLIFVLAWYFLWGPSSPPATEEALLPPAPVQGGQTGPNSSQVASPPPAPSATALESQLERVLSGIREANQKKDLAQFLNLYSPSFPNLSRRAQKISAAWQVYDYRMMEFKLGEIQPVNENTVQARVTWQIETQNRRTQSLKNVTQTYQVWFVKESGQWRIKALEKAG